MPYRHHRYARRVDADAIDVYTPGNTKQLRFSRAVVGTTRIFGTNNASPYINIIDGSTLGLHTATSAITVVHAGDISLTPSGNVKFGVKTGTGDVAVDGYVTIKSEAGATVKLATVA